MKNYEHNRNFIKKYKIFKFGELIFRQNKTKPYARFKWA